jgi:hypothetical protein
MIATYTANTGKQKQVVHFPSFFHEVQTFVCFSGYQAQKVREQFRSIYYLR